MGNKEDKNIIGEKEAAESGKYTKTCRRISSICRDSMPSVL